jgi:hypothetical protein
MLPIGSVRKSIRYIEWNAISIAQSKFEETLKPYAICDEK